MPNGGGDNFDKMPKLIAEIVEVQEIINEELQELYSTQRKIEESIKGLDERDKYLIRRKYIDNITWEELAVEMNYSWQHLHKLHSNILKQLNVR